MGQESAYQVVVSDSSNTIKHLKFNHHFEAIDSMDVLNSLNSIKNTAIAKGYIAASFDSLTWDKDTVSAFFQPGELYSWSSLKPGNVPEEYLSRARFREKLYREESMNPHQVGILFDRLLRFAQNNGYPFATVKLDSVHLGEKSIQAVLDMNLGPYTQLDSVIIKGKLESNRKYIENYIGFKKGSPYDQSVIDNAANRLKEIQFIQPIKRPEVGMRPGAADIYLYLDPKKASRFDGILGIQPDDVTGEIRITGDIKLNLLNALKRGESINLRWQSLQSGTQELNLSLEYPYLFDTPLGASFEFDLYRRDTLFSQVRSQIGVPYYLRGGHYIKVFYENLQSNVISNFELTLDEFVDSRVNMFGVGASYYKLDYRFNPRAGFFIDAEFAAGEKKIIENSEIDPSEYEDIELESDIYNLNLETGQYIPFGRRSTILLRVKSGYFANDNMFRNEMYRIGGLKTLRGFDEQSILASAFAIGTIEYRFLLEQNSNLFLFFDQGIYEDALRDDVIQDEPFGFGGGISFETKAGIFSLTYALGKQFDNPIEIRSGKIHFGFISFF